MDRKPLPDPIERDDELDPMVTVRHPDGQPLLVDGEPVRQRRGRPSVIPRRGPLADLEDDPIGPHWPTRDEIPYRRIAWP